MSKAIYAIKIVLFQDQFSLSTEIMRGLQKVAVFVSLVYVKQWQEAAIPQFAPGNDLDFIKVMQTYPDKEVVAVVTKSFSRHLWYLSEHWVSLAFFDERIKDEKKVEMLVKASKARG